MKEVRAVVLGLLVVVLVAIAISVWRRPARELRHVRGFRVEIQKTEGGSRRHVSFHVPISLVARVASLKASSAHQQAASLNPLQVNRWPQRGQVEFPGDSGAVGSRCAGRFMRLLFFIAGDYTAGSLDRD